MTTDPWAFQLWEEVLNNIKVLRSWRKREDMFYFFLVLQEKTSKPIIHGITYTCHNMRVRTNNVVLSAASAAAMEHAPWKWPPLLLCNAPESTGFCQDGRAMISRMTTSLFYLLTFFVFSYKYIYFKLPYYPHPYCSGSSKYIHFHQLAQKLFPFCFLGLFFSVTCYLSPDSLTFEGIAVKKYEDCEACSNERKKEKEEREKVEREL